MLGFRQRSIQPDFEATPSTSHPRDAAGPGMFFDGISRQPDEQTVFGATVAGQAFAEAILKHGSLDRYALFATAGREEFADHQAQEWRCRSANQARRIEVYSHARLCGEIDRLRLAAVHGPSGTFSREFGL